jgi:hypothetical protein
MIIISLFCLLRKEVRSTGRIWPNLRTSVSTWEESSSDWPKVDNLRFLDRSIASLHNPSLDFDFKITVAPRICCKTCRKKLSICSKIRKLVEKLTHSQICPFFFYSSKLWVEIKTWVFCTQIVTNSVQRFKTSGWMGLPRISNGHSHCGLQPFEPAKFSTSLQSSKE